MNKKFRKLILPVSLLLSSQTFALGLGGLQVDSALDEVLNGEIPFIIDSSEEIESIKVSVASFAEYEKVGLDKSYVPSNIQVGVVEKNGRKFVQLTSIGPVSEPIVSLLLVVDWSNGHLLREYTILLDPPLFNNTLTNEYSKPVETNTYEAPVQIESQAKPVNQSNAQIRSSTHGSSSQVVVESGDTLWKIASRFNASNTPQQMMVSIFNNNPDAFLNDDMNQLKKGAILTIPDSSQVSMISNGQATSEVKSHMQKWSRMQTEDSLSNSNIASTTDYGIELVPPSKSESSEKDYSTGNSTSSRVNAQTIADLNRAKEQLASFNLENSELSSRVRELEKIIEDQKLALSLKDSDLAQLQEMIKTDGQSGSTDTMSESTEADDVWDESEVNVANTSNDSMNEAMDDSMNEAMDDSMNETMDDSMNETMDDSMNEAMNDSMSETMEADASEDDGTIVIEDVTDSVSKIETTATDIPKKNESFLDKIMQYKFEGLIGLGVLLLGLLGFVFFKRKAGDDLSDSEGFLDSISSEHKNDDAPNDFDAPLDNSSTELDLTNLEEIDDLDDGDEELSEIELSSDENSIEIDSDGEPEVVVMDDSEEDLDDLEELDLDLEFGLDESLEEDLELDSESKPEQIDGELGNLEMEFELKENTLEEKTDSDELTLDFELDDLDLDAESDQEFELDLDLSSDDLEKVTEDAEELDDLVFDTGERTIVDAVESIGDELEKVREESTDLEFDLSDDLFDTDGLNLGNEEELAGGNDDITELNLETSDDEELDLNIDDSDDLELTFDSNEIVEIKSDPMEESSDDEDIDIGLDFDDLVSDDAIDTKLDLAKAYFEMGDIDGAQQMVNEIIEEGNDEQKSKAENLKSEIEAS